MDGEVILTTSQLIYVVIGAIVAGGGFASLGFSIFSVVVLRIMSNPALVTALEKLGDSVNPDTAVKIVNAARQGQILTVGLGDTAELVEEVFDGVPYADKTKVVQ